MNLTEITSKLADSQVDVYNVCKKISERVAESYEILSLLVEVTSQLEQAVGDDPSTQKFQAIADKITAAQQQSSSDLESLETVMAEIPIDKWNLTNMASTSFDQPPAPVGEPEETPAS